VRLALKIDVDTYHGVGDGGERLARFLHAEKIPASFFVTLGPDVSGWAVTRFFRHQGFMKKMQRTNAASTYGWRTIFSGTLLPARPVGSSFGETLRRWAEWGFEVSPHGYNHILWHDGAAGWSRARAERELDRITEIYESIFKKSPESFAAPGWQAGAGTWQAMEARHFLYHSDSRGTRPYFPQLNGTPLKTLEIPTTMATWDEMLAWDRMTAEQLGDETWKQLDQNRLNVWTLHAEVEGQKHFPLFEAFIKRLQAKDVEWVFLPDFAKMVLRDRKDIPAFSIEQGKLPGRAGHVSCQKVDLWTNGS
jgi:undecaprenyl phosphate-alpha-L-ara4FN deformylase